MTVQNPITLKVRMPAGLRTMLAERAASQGTSSSDYVRRAVIEALINNR